MAPTFVSIEGIEGSGKSTLLSSLAEHAAASGIDALVTREPGGTALGNRLRAAFVEPGLRIDPMAEAFVVNASRAQHVAEVIDPALAAGRTVLCDRFAMATLAYQGYGRGIDLEALRTLAAIATRGRAPDLTLLVDVPVEVSFARVRARARADGTVVDRLEREDAGFHARVREGYLVLARGDGRTVVLDGTLEPAALLAAAWPVLAAKLGV